MDTVMAIDAHLLLETRIHQIREDYGLEMSAKDLARAEGCSPETARRRLTAGDFGPPIRRNSRVIRGAREGYVEYIRRNSVISSSSSPRSASHP
jgi:hypothetical protein